MVGAELTGAAVVGEKVAGGKDGAVLGAGVDTGGDHRGMTVGTDVIGPADGATEGVRVMRQIESRGVVSTARDPSGSNTR